MADRRPYMTFGIEKLEALAEASKNDLTLRRDLIAELATFSKTEGALISF